MEGAGREHAGAPSSRDSGSPLLPREGVGGGGGADMESKERVDGFDLAAGGRLPGIGAHAVHGGARPGAKKHKKMVMAISQAELDARTARAPSPLAEDVAEYVPTTEMKSQVCVCVCVCVCLVCLLSVGLSVYRSIGLSVCLCTSFTRAREWVYQVDEMLRMGRAEKAAFRTEASEWEWCRKRLVGNGVCVYVCMCV